jgi:transcription initiation factor IIF auxiliary subunit
MRENFTVEQWEKYEGDDWWTWAVWISGKDEALDEIDHVEWTLHPTFPNPIRRIHERSTKFRLETGGWGGFTVGAQAQMKDGRQIKLRHVLKLHYPDGTETTA